MVLLMLLRGTTTLRLNTVSHWHVRYIKDLCATSVRLVFRALESLLSFNHCILGF